MGLIEIIIIISMILLNSVFAGYELALTTVNLGRLKLLAEQKKKGAQSALHMKSKIGASLAVVQIGVTLVGAIAAATSGAEGEEIIAAAVQSFLPISKTISEVIAIALIVLPLSFVTIIVGELVPKTIALKNNEKICLLLSPVMKGFSFLFYPSVLMLEWITKKIVLLLERNIKNNISQVDLGITELRAQARALRVNSVIDKEQEKIIIGASNLSKTKVIDIIIPAEDIVMLFVDGDLTEHFVTVHLEAFTRFPVAEIRSDPQSIIGFVNIKELIFLAKTHPKNPTLREILRPVLSFYSDISIGEALSTMTKIHNHLALVRDSEEKILGMITLEDILEEVVGDIQDEFDRLPGYINRFGRQFVVGGGVHLPILFDKIDHNGPFPEGYPNLTFNEWVIKNYDKKIAGGDLITISDIAILVRKVRRGHILEAIVSKM